MDGLALPENVVLRSTERIGARTDLSSIPKLSASASEFPGN